MNRCVLVALGLTLVVAESAMAQGPADGAGAGGAGAAAAGPSPRSPALPAVSRGPGCPGRPGSASRDPPASGAPAHGSAAVGRLERPEREAGGPLGSGGRSAPVPAARRRSRRPLPVRLRRGRGPRAVTAARQPVRGELVRRRERRLRRTVTRLRACLDGLPTLERRVLVLRAGLGPGRPRARARVARVLDLSGARVRRARATRTPATARARPRRVRRWAAPGMVGAAAPTTGEPSTTHGVRGRAARGPHRGQGRAGARAATEATGPSQSARRPQRPGPSCRPRSSATRAAPT